MVDQQIQQMRVKMRKKHRQAPTSFISEQKSLGSFIRENRKELDRTIKRVGPSCKLTNKGRRWWILNDEGLYHWARSEGVRI